MFEDMELEDMLLVAEIEELHRCKWCNEVPVEIGPIANDTEGNYYTRCLHGHLNIWNRYDGRYDVNG